VFWVAVLFAVFGSDGDRSATVTVFVIVPFWVGFTTIVTVAVAPLAKVPRLQVTPVFVRVQVPCVVETEPKPVVFGSVSDKVTPVAESGPLLVTTTV
jgi:hypothetical protein